MLNWNILLAAQRAQLRRREVLFERDGLGRRGRFQCRGDIVQRLLRMLLERRVDKFYAIGRDRQLTDRPVPPSCRD